MENLNAKPMALSFGTVAALIYIACWLFVAVFPLEAIIKVSNSLMHGIDVSSIAIKDTGFAESLLGFVVVVFGSIIIGYIFAIAYNWLNKRVK